MSTEKHIYRGGADTERLFLQDVEFTMPEGTPITVNKTNIPGVDMDDLVARHKARYYLLGLYCRAGYRVLDFPCGSGYASEILTPLGVTYEGREFDAETVEYAKKCYQTPQATFSVGDLTNPNLKSGTYDLIGCIEGLEHIEMKEQEHLISAFYTSLKPGGVLIVSSPENPTGVSGPSVHNPYHKHELTKKDFVTLLESAFGTGNVELITHKATLSTGVFTLCFYGICHKTQQ